MRKILPHGGLGTRMKKSRTQSRRHTDIYPTRQTGAGALDNSGATGTANDQTIADLVWKYFAEEIGATLREAQQVLAPEKGRLKTPSPRKNKQIEQIFLLTSSVSEKLRRFRLFPLPSLSVTGTLLPATWSLSRKKSLQTRQRERF